MGFVFGMILSRGKKLYIEKWLKNGGILFLGLNG